MVFELDTVKKYFQNDQFIVTNHARIRMFQRNISTDEIDQILQSCEIIKLYSEDKPCPSALVLGFWQRMPIHMVVAQCEDHARLITVYHPDKGKWIDFKIRKEK